MSKVRAVAPSATNFQLAAALDRYEEQMDRLERTGCNADVYRAVAARMREIRRYSASLPHVAVATVALLIAHGNLVSTFQERADRTGPRATHQASVEALRRCCLRQITRSET